MKLNIVLMISLLGAFASARKWCHGQDYCDVGERIERFAIGWMNKKFYGCGTASVPQRYAYYDCLFAATLRREIQKVNGAEFNTINKVSKEKIVGDLITSYYTYTLDGATRANVNHGLGVAQEINSRPIERCLGLAKQGVLAGYSESCFEDDGSQSTS
jgi:hypothetical protein